MEKKRYKPLTDQLFWMIFLPMAGLMSAATVILAILHPSVLFLMIPLDIFVGYFLISPLFGYVELRESTLFIRYGFFLKKEIPYNKIKDLEKCRKWYSDSMMALKNSLEHINIKYNAFDVTTVSVVDNDDLIHELKARMK